MSFNELSKKLGGWCQKKSYELAVRYLFPEESKPSFGDGESAPPSDTEISK
jgi:hypothetical protein